MDATLTPRQAIDYQILSSYGAKGYYPGVYDLFVIEFSSVHSAAAWVEASGIQEHVKFRYPVIDFGPCEVMVSGVGDQS